MMHQGRKYIQKCHCAMVHHILSPALQGTVLDLRLPESGELQFGLCKVSILCFVLKICVQLPGKVAPVVKSYYLSR